MSTKLGTTRKRTKKEFNEKNHPRYPEGHPLGGQFMPKSGNTNSKTSSKNTTTNSTTSSKTNTSKKSDDSNNDLKSLKLAALKEVAAKYGVKAKDGRKADSWREAIEEAKTKKSNSTENTKQEITKTLSTKQVEKTPNNSSDDLKSLKLAALKKIATEHGVKAKDGRKSDSWREAIEQARSKKIINTLDSKENTKKENSINKNITGTHEDIPDYTNNKSKKEAIKKLSEILNIDEKEANFIAKQLNSWTKTGYKKIKKDQKEGKITPEIEALDKYITKMPKYKGEIARGLTFKNQEDLSKFLKNAERGLELDSHSSFSSNVDLAKKFALGSGGTSTDNMFGVLLIVKNNKSGISVKSFSSSDYKDENEIIGKKGIKYKIIGKPKIVYEPDITKDYEDFKQNQKEFFKTLNFSKLRDLSKLMNDEELTYSYNKIRKDFNLSEKNKEEVILEMRNKKSKVKSIVMLELEEYE